MECAFFIVMHLSKTSVSDYLVQRLQPLTSLRCQVATDAIPIEANHIYVAHPNEHLIVVKNQIVVGYGPEENRWRPSIDVLFRTAAAAYNARVVGIILTGMLSDGTSGMNAIKRSGGISIVQDPNEAEFPDMPLNVLNNMEVDYIVSLASIGNILIEVIKGEPSETIPPADVIVEASIAEKMAVGIDNVERLGAKSVFACPDCGGGLWKVEGDSINRFRCHIGHAYDEQSLLLKQGESIESTLWVALRMMEERGTLFSKIASDNKRKGLTRIATTYQDSANALKKHVEKLKDILITFEKGKQVEN